jgi:hypothetical protein
MQTIDTTLTLVDQLGILKAEIAALQAEEKKLKEQLIALGLGSHEGLMYDANVTEKSRDSLDMDAVRAKLSPQFMRAHTKTTTYPEVRVTARKGK